MVPDKFNMVDMGGIDLIMMQGEAVPGLYDKLMAAISACQYQCLYHWMFDSVLIPPVYVQMTVVDGEIYINGGVSVTSDDVIHIYTISPGPTPPAIIPLLVEENGTYNTPFGVDGFNPVTVDVPSYTPIIESLSITENGAYTAPSGIDGYSPIVVDVSGGGGTVPTFLSNSIQGDILANSYYSQFTAGGNKWGNLDVTGLPTIDASGIHTASGNGFSYDLGNANHDVTIYAIVKGYAGGDLFALGTTYGLSTGNTISIFTRNISWYSAVWGDDSNTNVDYRYLFAVLTVAINAQEKKAYYYINGVQNPSGYKSFNNSGQIVRFNGSNSHTDRAGIFDYLYAGVVDGCEDSATILANQQVMMNFLSTGRMFIP